MKKDERGSHFLGKTSIGHLKALSFQEAMALVRSQYKPPRHIYGKETERRALSENVNQQIWSIAGRGELRDSEVAQVTLLLSLLTGEWRVCGIDPKGEFRYAIVISSEPWPTTPEVIARAHHQHLLEILQKRLLRHRKLDEISILLMGVTGVLEFMGIDRNGDLEIKIISR